MASNPGVLWYVTRAAGLVSLVLLTAVVVLGILLSTRWATSTWPRFLSQYLHRSLSLTAVVFLLLHILTAVLDPFAHLGLTDALIPFTSSYRSLWLGLGVVASELIAALVISSLLRARLGFRTWRVIHWLAYVSWPIAIVHGLGTGTDARVGWALLLDAGCVAAVLVAVAMRLSGGPPRWLGVRALAGLATAAATLALAVWTVTGPLQPGWARAAGTPAGLLATTGSAVGAASPSPAPVAAGPSPGSQGAVPVGLSVRVRGSAVQNADGSTTLTLTDESSQNLQVVLSVPVAGGSALQLTLSQSGAGLCSTAASFDGGVVTATCGATQLTLALRSSDDGGIRGTMTTVAATR
jgi:sulfoxide reductase heme-binding subunit YedZ